MIEIATGNLVVSLVKETQRNYKANFEKCKELTDQLMTLTVSSRSRCGKLSVCYTEMQARCRSTSSLKRSKWKWEKASLVQAMLSLAKENGSGVRLRWPRQC